MMSNLKAVAGNILKERKPWAEIVDRSAFSKPANFAEASGRLRKNAAYFRVNYFIVLSLITFVCFAFNPYSLFVLAALAFAWAFVFIIRPAPITIGGRTFSDKEKFIALSAISGVVVFFLTSVGTVLFTAIGISLTAIGIHGACRQPDDLFTEEAEQQGGLLGFLTAPTAPAGSIV